VIPPLILKGCSKNNGSTPGKSIWLFGGASLVTAFINKNW
jgi:dihydrofolate reductase